MKKEIIFLFNTLIFSSNVNPAQTISKLVTPVFYTDTIKQKDLNQSATSIYKISRPGRYYVASDLTFTPTNNNAIGIEIAASNVTIDLNTKTLNHNSNSRAGFIFIKLDGGNSNITITNGKILSDGNGKNAILIDRGSTVGSPVVNNINLNNLIIRKFNSSLINESGTSTVIANGLNISNVDMSNMVASTTTNTCNLNYRNNINIQDTTIHNCSTSSGNLANFHQASCNNTKFINVNCSNNSAASWILEFDIIGNHIYFKNCICSNSSSGSGAAIFAPYGNVITFESCSVFNASAGTDLQGFYPWNSKSVIYRNCIVKGSTGGVSATAFINNPTNGTLIENCTVSNISSPGQVIGFYDNNQPSSVIFRNCIAQKIYSSGADAYGFWIVNGKQHLFENCTARGCQSTGNYKAVGFYLINETNDCIFNCKSYSNYAPSNIGAGIYLDSSVTNCVTIGNQLFNNTGTSQYGYYDATALTSTTNWIAKNVAFGQGVSQVTASGPAYNSSKCNYFIGTASSVINDRMTFINDVSKEAMTTLDTAKTNWENVSVY